VSGGVTDLVKSPFCSDVNPVLLNKDLVMALGVGGGVSQMVPDCPFALPGSSPGSVLSPHSPPLLFLCVFAFPHSPKKRGRWGGGCWPGSLRPSVARVTCLAKFDLSICWMPGPVLEVRVGREADLLLGACKCGPIQKWLRIVIQRPCPGLCQGAHRHL
jgi:hypothetical protein